jgi:hypothetical protein
MTGDPLRTTLLQVHELYTSPDQVQRLRHQIDHPVLRQVHRDIRHLGFLVELEQREDTCGPLLRRLRRFSFLSASTPLPFDHALLWPPQAAELLAEAISLYPRRYPNFSEVVLRIRASLDTLQAEPTNPLWAWLTTHVSRHTHQEFWLRRSSDHTLILADTRVVRAVEALVEAQQLNLRVSTPLAFQGERLVSRQTFLGSSRWFPEWCFTAPRSRQIDLVQYHWVWDDGEYPAAFPFNQRSVPGTSFVTASAPELASSTAPQGMEEPAEEPIALHLPTLDWQRLLAHERLEPGDDEEARDAVPARLYALQGYVGVWLACEEDETVLGLHLDPDEPGKHRVERLKVQELEPGDYVLLRTEGAGDLLDTLAGQLLGSEGTRARQIHQEWKKVVRQQVFRCVTYEKAVRRLRDFGAVKASVGNLRHWEKDDNLRPQRDEDFHALVAFCGMEARTEEITQAAERLRFAQQSAGHRISQMIRTAIAVTDLTPLEREGRQVFTLPITVGGGTFTAFSVVAISEQEAWITPSRLNRPISLEEQEYE